MWHFANPWFLVLLVLIPWFVLRYRRREREGSGSLRFASTIAMEGIRRSWSIRARYALFAVDLVAFALVVLAMARPQRGIEEEEVLTEGIDIVIALDASGSMAAEDFSPRNRFYVAKMVAGKFVEGLRHDRVGLVVFAGKAVTRCPLTLDYAVAQTVINDIQLGTIEDGTAIGNALAACLNRLRGSEAKSKVIVLVTDGVNNRGEIQPLDAAKISRTLGVKIYTIGIGSEGTARVPVNDPKYGTVYVNLPVEIDEASLRQIAQMTGGIYYRATDRPSLERIFDQIGRLEKSKIQVLSYRSYSERFSSPLGAALGLVLVVALAAATRFSKLP